MSVPFLLVRTQNNSADTAPTPTAIPTPAPIPAPKPSSFVALPLDTAAADGHVVGVVVAEAVGEPVAAVGVHMGKLGAPHVVAACTVLLCCMRSPPLLNPPSGLDAFTRAK